MIYKGFFLVFTVLFSAFACYSQQKQFKVKTIAFYNVENLFDTINDPLTFDDDRTPEGKENWTSAKYNDKVAKIAKVISDLGANVTQTAPDIVGVCEIENETVLVDVINDPQLKKYNYGIVHFESPDLRGVDVALLYKKAVFAPTDFESYELELWDEDGTRDYTRNQLLVTGMFEGEEMHFIVNHWPSRRGGEARSRPRREAAAALNKKLIDSLQKINPKAKIISMGDFNDDATNSSFKKVLKTEGEKKKAKGLALFNPMEEMLKKGVGSLAYRDSWNLFDQIYLTSEFLLDDKSSYRFWKANVYNKPYLVTPSGPYKGYPYRSYTNGSYTGGYSDHFPVYVFLVKEVTLN